MQLIWDDPVERTFEAGVDRVVLYVDGLDGVAWNGVTQVIEMPTGGEARPYYIDGVKYLNLSDSEEFAGSISAFYSPEEFDLCDGAIAHWRGVYAHQQIRRPFCLSYRTRFGNDTAGIDNGYKLHIVYNAMATPTSRSYGSNGSDVDALSLTWKFTTRNIPFPNLRPTAHITIDSTKANATALQRLEDALYGTPDRDPYVPYPSEILSFFALFSIIDNGDGTFTISGDDLTIADNGNGTFTLNADSVTSDGTTYSATSP